MSSLITGLPTNIIGDGKYIGGGFIGGFKEGIERWHSLYYSVLSQHSVNFIGKDQPWMYKTCMVAEDLCSIINPDLRLSNDPWFYMARFMHGDMDDL